MSFMEDSRLEATILLLLRLVYVQSRIHQG